MATITFISEIRPYSAKELADIYGVCDKTIKKWIRPFSIQVGEKQGRYYNVAQVKIIFERLGVPCKMTEQAA
jgi:uncharacterized protein YjcR